MKELWLLWFLTFHPHQVVCGDCVDKWNWSNIVWTDSGPLFNADPCGGYFTKDEIFDVCKTVIKITYPGIKCSPLNGRGEMICYYPIPEPKK